MFTAGTRIVLQASSLAKEKGPKRGSIGYVINAGDLYEIPPIDNRQFAASCIEVMFSRYGLEKRNRCEHRPVMSILPLFKTGEPIVDFEEVLDHLAKDDLRSNISWRHVLNNFFDRAITPNALVGVAIPALSLDARNMSELQSQAWSESLLRSKRFIESCRRCYTTRRFEALGIDETLLRWLADAHLSKVAKLSLSGWVEKDKTNRQKFITALRKLDSIYHRRETSGHLRFFDKVCASKAVGKGHMEFMRLMTQHFFEPGMLERKEVLLTEKKQEQVLIDAARGMRKVRDTMLSLVPKIG